MTHIRSWRWLVFVLCCFSCGHQSKLPPPPLGQLPGGFQFAEMVEVPAGEVPEPIRGAGLQSAHRSMYRGPSPLTVTVYEMNNGASAFELVQKWRPAPGLIYFHSGARFAIVEAKALGQPELNEVAKALEAHLSRIR